jgi:hypothetical protein
MNEIIIYDLEYTTWHGAIERNWSKENEIREITWIAAILVDVNTLQEIDSLDCIIKPTMNPVLSEYFIDLTGLTQQKVDKKGISFFEGVREFQRFVNSRPIVCHGGDTVVFLENFQLKNLKFRARRMDDDVPIVLNLNKDNRRQDDEPIHPQSLMLNAYGSDMKMVEENTYRVVCEVDLKHPGQFISPSIFTSFNIKLWFNRNAPETIGKYAGELAAAFGKFTIDGNIHEPLFDVRSILHGAKHLIKNCGAENILNEFLSKNNLIVH